VRAEQERRSPHRAADGGPSDRVPVVSVVVVTWNGREYLGDCLGALEAQQDVSAETILVDNASTDGTVEYVRERFPWVRLVALPENRGFAGGNNAGVQQARGRYVALLNNDAIPEPDWLRALLDEATRRTGAVLLTSRVVYAHDPDVIDSAGDGFLRWGGAFKRFHGAPARAASAPAEVFGVCGAACLMPKRVFDELGGFDEDFFVSHEDVDLSYRARLLGYHCRYVPGAVVRHHGSPSIGRASELAVFHGQRNLEWVYFKNTPWNLIVWTLPGHVVYTLAAAVHFAGTGRLGAFLRAKTAAVRSLPDVLRKRRVVQRTRRVGDDAIWSRLEGKWLAVKRAEKQFDAALARRGR
jgi:hypothetical protein